MWGRGSSWATGASSSRASPPTTQGYTPARRPTPWERGCPTWSTSTSSVSGYFLFVFIFLSSHNLFLPQKITFWLIHTFLLREGGKSPPTDWSAKIFCHSFITLSTISAKQLVKNISNFWDNASINFVFLSSSFGIKMSLEKITHWEFVNWHFKELQWIKVSIWFHSARLYA